MVLWLKFEYDHMINLLMMHKKEELKQILIKIKSSELGLINLIFVAYN